MGAARCSEGDAAGADAGMPDFFGAPAAAGEKLTERPSDRPRERTKSLRGFIGRDLPCLAFCLAPSVGSKGLGAAGSRGFEVGANRAERLLVQGHVLREGVQEL